MRCTVPLKQEFLRAVASRKLGAREVWSGLQSHARAATAAVAVGQLLAAFTCVHA